MILHNTFKAKQLNSNHKLIFLHFIFKKNTALEILKKLNKLIPKTKYLSLTRTTYHKTN
jgi:uncharacterized protein (DUF1499 family)